MFEEGKAVLTGTEGLLRGRSRVLADGIAPETQYVGAFVLTLINPRLGKEANLPSGQAYLGRADAFVFMGMFEEALGDLDFAVGLQRGESGSVLSKRCFVKVNLGALLGALDDANEALKVSNSAYRPFAFQERGVLKRILGDLQGALADLDEGLELETDDYESLKHRGYVKFLLKDEEGARADAEWALRIKHPMVDRRDYGRNCLGTSPVEYLGYQLR